jgi:hypothetical protein
MKNKNNSEALELRNGRYFPVTAEEISESQAHLKCFCFLNDEKGLRIKNLKSLDIPEGMTIDDILRKQWSVTPVNWMASIRVFKPGQNLCRIKDEDLLEDDDYSYQRQAFFKRGQRKATGDMENWRAEGAAIQRVSGFPAPLKAAINAFAVTFKTGQRKAFSRQRLVQEVEKTDLKPEDLDSFLKAVFFYISDYILQNPAFDQELAIHLVKVVNTKEDPI